MRKFTNKEFIEKSIKIHGTKYDYSLINYKNSGKKVLIICKNHGNFEQLPGEHLRGRGCAKCSIEQKTLSLQEFIEKANKIHHHDYDYSLVEYKNVKTKVKIICKKHGIYIQIPAKHLTGGGCPKCSNVYSPTTEEFIEKAIKVHGNDKFLYTKTKYITNDTKIVIECRKHGDFLQSPSKHLQGQGCPNCNKTFKLNKLSTKEFIEKAIKIHDHLYEYADSIYVNNNIKLSIKCKLHGNFLQVPYKHLQGHGCPKCKTGKNELITGEVLNAMLGPNIKLETQKRFNIIGINSRNYIYVDFYFELNNKKYIVEYNGLQHYEPWWHAKPEVSKQNYIKQQKRDEGLRDFCLKENIFLIEIDGRKYTNNKIKDFLVEEFNRLGVVI